MISQQCWLVSPEPMVVDKPQSTRVEGASIVMESFEALVRHLSDQAGDLNGYKRTVLTIRLPYGYWLVR
jgi:hypothetical protein